MHIPPDHLFDYKFQEIKTLDYFGQLKCPQIDNALVRSRKFPDMDVPPQHNLKKDQRVPPKPTSLKTLSSNRLS